MLIRRQILFSGVAFVAWAVLATGVSAAKEGESDGGSGSGSDHESGSDSSHGSESNSEGGSEHNSGTGSDSKPDAGSHVGSTQNSGSSNPDNSRNQGNNNGSGRAGDRLRETDKDHNNQSDQDKAFAAAEKGEIMSLKDVLKEVSSRYDGKVIEIKLRSNTTSEIYQMKLRMPDGTIKILKMDARTGKFAGLFGF